MQIAPFLIYTDDIDSRKTKDILSELNEFKNNAAQNRKRDAKSKINKYFGNEGMLIENKILIEAKHLQLFLKIIRHVKQTGEKIKQSS